MQSLPLYMMCFLKYLISSIEVYTHLSNFAVILMSCHFIARKCSPELSHILQKVGLYQKSYRVLGIQRLASSNHQVSHLQNKELPGFHFETGCSCLISWLINDRRQMAWFSPSFPVPFFFPLSWVWVFYMPLNQFRFHNSTFLKIIQKNNLPYNLEHSTYLMNILSTLAYLAALHWYT